MTDQPRSEPGPEDPGTEPGGPPPLTDEEREMLEQQMKEIRVEDLLTQTVASVLNLSARRIVKEDEVDLDQARIGIEAVRSIVALLPTEVGEAIREPLSQVQMLYAQRSGGSSATGAGEDQPAGGGSGPGEQPAQPDADGPARPTGPSRLWTPGSG